MFPFYSAICSVIVLTHWKSPPIVRVTVGLIAGAEGLLLRPRRRRHVTNIHPQDLKPGFALN